MKRKKIKDILYINKDNINLVITFKYYDGSETKKFFNCYKLMSEYFQKLMEQIP